jgi:ribonuclease HI
VTALAYADDIALVSSTAEGLQRQLDTVGDFCKWSGLSVNVGREKSATMDSKNAVNHQFTLQDSIDGEVKPLFKLNGSPYKYLGTLMQEKEGEFSDWLPEVENRIQKLKERHARLRLKYISIRQCAGIVTQYLSSVLRYPASLGPYPTTKIEDPLSPMHHKIPSDILDEIVYQAAKQTLRNRKHADHLAFQLPEGLHGLGIAKVTDVQTVESCCDALSHLNSADIQVRETTRHVLHHLQARGLAGRRIGAGLGLLLKFIQTEKSGIKLAKLGREQDVFQTELPVAWLAATYPSLRGVGFDKLDTQWLCNQGILTVQQLMVWTEAQGPCRPLTESLVQWAQGRPSMCLGRRRGEGKTAQAYYKHKLSACIDGSPLWVAAMDRLQAREAEDAGNPNVVQSPWPEVDGVAHPSVHVNVDGSQFSGPNCAGAGILVHGPDGKSLWSNSILEHEVRVLGSQDNARAEMLAMFVGLRSCRNVPHMKMHSDCSYVLDTMAKHWAKDGRPTLKPLPRTTNFDLISAIVRELDMRDANHAPGHLSLHKVRSHVDETPIEHVDVDVMAKNAASLALPTNWQQLLSPQYTIMCGGCTHNVKEFRALINKCHRDRDAASLPAHLQHLADPRLDHTLSHKMFKKGKGPFHESTLRATFGMSMHHFQYLPGHGHKCCRCPQYALGTSGALIVAEHLHSADAMRHMLFHCTATDHLRDVLQLKCDAFTAKMKAKHPDHDVPDFYVADVVCDALNDQPWHPDEFPVDPRGFFMYGASAQLCGAGLDAKDMARLFGKCGPHVLDILRLAADAPPDPVVAIQAAPAIAGRCHRSGIVFV